MMKNNLTRLLRILFIIVAVVMITGPLFPLLAQVTPPPDPCPGGEPCDPDVPITGIEWLLITGGLFGARKIYRRFRRDNN